MSQLNTISTTHEYQLYFESARVCECGHEQATHHGENVRSRDGRACLGVIVKPNFGVRRCQCRKFKDMDWVTGLTIIPEKIIGTAHIILP